MNAHPACELRESADILLQLAAVVDEAGLSACDIGGMLWDSFRQSPVEPAADVRLDILQLKNCDISTQQFVSGLRRQADELLQQAAAVDAVG